MKKQVKLKYIFAMLVLAVLSACASRPSYVAPAAGQATATIKTGLLGSGNAGPIYIGMAEGGCSRAQQAASFFSVSNGNPSPAGELKVPANQLIAFTYSSGGPNVKACRTSLETVLEAGKTYYLIGGDIGNTNSSSSLTQKACRLGINEATADKRVADRTCS